MKISIIKIDPTEQEEIIIHCHPENKGKMLSIANHIRESADYFTCKKDGQIYNKKLSDVYYFEVVDEKLFIYFENEVFENRMRLYEVEEQCQGGNFFRASKSMLVNITKIDSMKPSFSGKFELILDNGEKIHVSRKYVVELKRRMGL